MREIIQELITLEHTFGYRIMSGYQILESEAFITASGGIVMNYKLTINYVARPKILINVFEDTITSESGINESGAIEMIQDKVLERSNDLECEFTVQHVLNVVKLRLAHSICKSKDDSLRIVSNDIRIRWSDGTFKINGDIYFTSEHEYKIYGDNIAFLISDALTLMLNRQDFYIDLTPITNLEYEFDFEIAIEVNETDVEMNVDLELLDINNGKES